MNIAKIQSDIRDVAKLSLRWAAIASGKKPLSKEESYQVLSPGKIWGKMPQPVTLPALNSLNEVSFFPEDLIVSFDEDAVWQINCSCDNIRKAVISRAGTPIVNNNLVIDVDFGNTAGLFTPSFKQKTVSGPVIAPWAHFWGGFYDYTFFVAAKLLRIKSQVAPAIWEKAITAYPLQGTAYEKQWLALLGIAEHNRLDTSAFGTITADELFLGNNQQWFYPSPEDVLRMRSTFSLTPEIKPGKRLFLSRKNTRVLLNETEIAPMLHELGFEIVEDKSRTIVEQIEIFSGAEIILGVHGAAFTNILWAPAGAQIIELFAASYYPPYFYYLAHVLGQRYNCIIETPAVETHHSAKLDDMRFNPDELRELLQTVV